MILLSDRTQKTWPSAPAPGAGRRPQHSSVYISESSRLDVGIVLLLFVATCTALTGKDPVEDDIFAHYHVCRTFVAPGMERHMVFMVRKDLFCAFNAGDLARHR